MSEICYLNGELIPREQAKISLLDYGFLYGYGLYETVRAYDGKAFRLDNHLARLRYSGDRIDMIVHPALIREAVNDVIKANSFHQTRLRITLSPGEGSMSPNLASCLEPTIAVLASEYKPPNSEKYSQGYKAVISSIRRNSRSPVTYLKSANTMENMLARREAGKASADEALFLNEKGSNVFLVKNGILFTPRYGAGILPGVTRVVVFELASQLGIIVKELNIKTSALVEADETFVTNSLIEVMPLTMVDEKPIGSGKAGILTLKLMNAYREMVEKET
jgi:branched-chain amino acid aminotransferase